MTTNFTKVPEAKPPPPTGTIYYGDTSRYATQFSIVWHLLYGQLLIGQTMAPPADVHKYAVSLLLILENLMMAHNDPAPPDVMEMLLKVNDRYLQDIYPCLYPSIHDGSEVIVGMIDSWLAVIADAIAGGELQLSTNYMSLNNENIMYCIDILGLIEKSTCAYLYVEFHTEGEFNTLLDNLKAAKRVMFVLYSYYN
jgi:hypothetical protein